MSFLNLNLKKENTSSPKTDAYVQQAQNVWSMLDDMAANDPKAYKLIKCIFNDYLDLIIINSL